MFNDPVYFIFGGAALVLLLTIIYFITQKAKADKSDKMKKEVRSNSHTPKNTKAREALGKDTETKKAPITQEVPEIQKEEQETEIVEEKPQKLSTVVDNQYNDNLQGSEEGDFGEAVSEEEITSSQEISQKTLAKREVPEHGKITKQHFSEFSGVKILIAEDNLINQKVLTGLLAGSGIEITIANDGQEALDILEENDDFLMILMDAHMPRVDGFEATRIIRANPKYDHILVVALSGDTAADDIKKMKEAGMAEQLEKPLRMEALYDILYAYTGVDNSQKNEDDIIEVIATKNLDGVKGLEVCGGDENFYHEILDEFISNYGSSTEKLGNLLRDGDLKHADRVLLDIIGITANIGAQPLNSIANDIKASLHDSKEKSYLTYVDEYKRRLEALIKDIKDYR